MTTWKRIPFQKNVSHWELSSKDHCQIRNSLKRSCPWWCESSIFSFFVLWFIKNAPNIIFCDWTWLTSHHINGDKVDPASAKTCRIKSHTQKPTPTCLWVWVVSRRWCVQSIDDHLSHAPSCANATNSDSTILGSAIQQVLHACPQLRLLHEEIHKLLDLQGNRVSQWA